MDWPVSRDLDPAYAEEPTVYHCDECGESAEVDERGRVLCDECREIAALPWCEEHATRGRCKTCDEEMRADIIIQRYKDGET